MPTYHCFFLARDGHLTDVGFEECGDDAAAIHWAERRARGQATCRQIELWRDDRLVSARLVNDGPYKRLVSEPPVTEPSVSDPTTPESQTAATTR